MSEGFHIPDGWSQVSLRDVLAEVYRYPTYYGIEYQKDGVPEVQGGLIRDDGTIETNTSAFRFISESTASRFPRVRLQPGDFVISVRGCDTGFIDPPHNPCRFVKRLTEENRVERYIDDYMLISIVACSSDHAARAFLIARYTGLRHSHLLALDWSQINGGMIHPSPALCPPRPTAGSRSATGSWRYWGRRKGRVRSSLTRAILSSL